MIIKKIITSLYIVFELHNCYYNIHMIIINCLINKYNNTDKSLFCITLFFFKLKQLFFEHEINYSSVINLDINDL